MKKISVKLDIKDVSMSWNLSVPSEPLLSIKGPLGTSTIETKKLDARGLVVFQGALGSTPGFNTRGSTLSVALQPHETRPHAVTPKDWARPHVVTPKDWARPQLLSQLQSRPCGARQLGPRPCVDNCGVQPAKRARSLIKTICSLIKNEILGVSQGYLLHLDIVGIGYKVTINKQLLYFKLGFSHKIKYELPDNVRAFSTKANHLCLYSISWSMLKQTAAKIKALKNPEPYKGKGIRYRGEIINLKIGKRK